MIRLLNRFTDFPIESVLHEIEASVPVDSPSILPRSASLKMDVIPTPEHAIVEQKQDPLVPQTEISEKKDDISDMGNIDSLVLESKTSIDAVETVITNLEM